MVAEKAADLIRGLPPFPREQASEEVAARLSGQVRRQIAIEKQVPVGEVGLLLG